jgi:hypothetical protein
MPEVVTEAIVVIDLVESTLTSNMFGWYAVGPPFASRPSNLDR